MPYIQTKDFKLGLDRRRPRIAGGNGTLWDIKNAHLTRGGDIERAKKFVPTFTLPAGTTKGLHQIKGQLYVFGESASPGTIPTGVNYQRLNPGDGSTLTRVLHATSFAGQAYVVAEFSNGQIRHFLNGTLLTDQDTLSDANASFSALADYFADKLNARTDVTAAAVGATLLVTASTAGVAFTLSGSATNGGSVNDQTITITTPQVNVPAVTEVRATATLLVTSGSNAALDKITVLTAGATPLIAAAVAWAGSTASTAAAVVSAINALTPTHGYSAVNVTNTVTISAPVGQGASANFTVLAATLAGAMAVTTLSFSGGVTAVTPLKQISQVTFGGTFEALDQFNLVVNGTSYAATGRAAGSMSFAFTYKKRIYGPATSLLRYSKLNDGSNWSDVTAASGAGFINLSNDVEGAERLVSIAKYQTYVAMFSRRSIVIYSIDTDATKNTVIQPLENTGALAARSVISYGNNDTFYLDETGIRSLKARDASNAAFISDIGSAIDTHVRAWIDSQSNDVVSRSIGLVEPIDGRFWLAVGTRIYVLSYFPSSSISAWSYYEPGFVVDDMVRALNRVYVRSGDTIYLYGGQNNQTYPSDNEQIVTVKLPFLSAEKPGTMKKIYGYDLAGTGEWLVELLPDANNEAAKVTVGRINTITYDQDDIGVNCRNGVIAVDLTCTKGGYATLSMMSIHHNLE